MQIKNYVVYLVENMGDTDITVTLYWKSGMNSGNVEIGLFENGLRDFYSTEITEGI